MGLFERIRNLVRYDLTSLISDPHVGLWKAFLYIGFLTFVALLFVGQYLPTWSFPLGKGRSERPPTEMERSRPDSSPVRNI